MIGLKEIVIIILIFFLLFHKDIFSYYQGKTYKNIARGDTKKTNVKSKTNIPKIIYKTGIDEYKSIHKDVLKVFSETIRLNPDFKISYYSDKDSRNFIKNNFDNEILTTYDKLIPGAYKADLFRYCILYINGGIYSDLTQRFTIPFKEFIDFENDNLYLVKDIDHYKINGDGYSNGIQISFIVSRPGNEIFLRAINQIVKNVNKKYYGDNPLYPTGPSLFYNILQDYKGKYKIELKETGNNKIINDKGDTVIISKINNHQSVILKNKEHYTILWRNRRIYKI